MASRTTTPTDISTEPTVYRGPAAAGAPPLAGVRGASSVVEGPETVRETQRYDSPDLRLATSGIVLAVHRSADEEYWRLDLPDAVDGERLQVPVSPSGVEGLDSEVPAELVEIVRGVLRGAQVVPVGRVRRVGRTLSLRDGRRRETATLELAEVQLATFGAETRLENWSEATVRLTLVAPASLGAALAGALGETGAAPARGDAAAELERLLREAAPTPPVRAAGPKGHPAGPVLAYAGRYSDVLAAEDIRARRDEEDSVHQLRVSARRIRSVLQAYRRLFDRPRTDALIAELRWLGQELAPARDLEVLEERITVELASLPPELLLGPVQAQVTRHFARSRAEARAAMLATLDGGRYAALRGALERFLQDPPLADPRTRGAKKGRAELAALRKRTHKRFEHRMRAAIEALREGTDADLPVHEARKAGKRLRYATEVVGGKKDRRAKELKALQKALGAHQDTVVARAALRDLGARAHSEGANGFTFGVLHGRARSEAQRIEETLLTL